MPIVRLPVPDSPLCQGDILSGINLFATGGSHLQDGGSPTKLGVDLCLVLSRPCVALRDPVVIAAAVDKFKASPPRDLTTFDRILSFLKKYRDGHGSPDVFYLGQLPGKEGRYAARLDSLHSIQVPSDEAPRRDFLRDRRVLTLLPDFVRDLHVRVFGAVSSLGFDDHSWFADGDLVWLVREGELELQKMKAIETEQLALKAKQDAEGARFSEKLLDETQKSLAELGALLAPYQKELQSRQHL